MAEVDFNFLIKQITRTSKSHHTTSAGAESSSPLRVVIIMALHRSYGSTIKRSESKVLRASSTSASRWTGLPSCPCRLVDFVNQQHGMSSRFCAWLRSRDPAAHDIGRRCPRISASHARRRGHTDELASHRLRKAAHDDDLPTPRPPRLRIGLRVIRQPLEASFDDASF
jgi:hypothetical protein